MSVLAILSAVQKRYSYPAGCYPSGDTHPHVLQLLSLLPDTFHPAVIHTCCCDVSQESCCVIHAYTTADYAHACVACTALSQQDLRIEQSRCAPAPPQLSSSSRQRRRSQGAAWTPPGPVLPALFTHRRRCRLCLHTADGACRADRWPRCGGICRFRSLTHPERASLCSRCRRRIGLLAIVRRAAWSPRAA